MAKYRITSIPQAKKGKIVKSEETPNFPMVEVQGVQQPSYWNESSPGYMRGEGCPPGMYDFNGQCLPESEYIAASKAEMQKEQEDFDAKSLARKLALVKDVNDIRSKTNEEHARWDADDTNRYLETFAKSKKQDKIEPYKKFPETEVTPEIEAEFKNNFLVHKKDGFVELFPKNIVQDRIITNGFQADQFKNYWGLDPKQVKEQLGDLMGAAKANYEAEVTKSILTKAIEQGKPVDQVIKGLSPKVGQQSNLKATFEKPTNKIIDDAYASLVSSMDAIPGTDRAKVEQDRKIFLESDDPMDAWERRYHSGTNNLGDFINYQSQKTERGEKAYSDWMDKYGKAGQYDGLTFAKDDAMANVRQNNALLNQTLNQKNALAAANTAKAKDFNDAYAAYLGNFQSDATKQVLKQALDKAGSNAQGKLEILKSFQEDPNQAMQKLLEQKTGNKKETYADVLNSSVDAMLMRELNPDTIKQGTGINENTTGSKIRDVLANPFDAAYFAMNPREEMWGNSNQSYETRKDIADKFGVDTGLMPNDNPLAIVRDYTMLQAANPFKIGTNLRKGYDKGEFLNALGDELIDIGTKRGMMKGTNALLSGQGFKQGLQAFNNPLFTAGFMAKTPENISNAYNNFQQGNYGTAALDALEGYWGAAPLIRGIKPAVGTLQTLNSLRTPGTVAFGNIPSRFTGVYNAATPGSGLVLGNPNITGAKPVYESITNPLNKASKRLGLGEFSILEQNPEGYLGTGSYPLLGYSDGGLIKARTGTIVKGLQALGASGKTAARMANIGTIGTVNSLAKNIAPIMINPVRIPMLGASIEKMGPFTGSPLNALPFYGEKMNPLDGTAFRKFGDTLDYVKMSGELNPAAGPLLRMGKKQIMSEGNWAEPYEPNEQYSGVFGAQFNRNVPGSDLGFEKMSNRNGVLVTDALGNRKPSIPLSEPGLSFHRRLPFSNRYIPVNMDKLRNDQFDWRTQGGNLQSLIERYGYGAAYAAALAGMGMAAPQEYLDEYVTEPIKKVYGKAEELLTNPWVKDSTPLKKEGGALPKANLGQIVKAGTKLTNAAKPAIYLMESPALRVTVPEFESLVNENLVKGLGIKKIDDQLKIKINPKIDSKFDPSGNPLLNLDMATYVGNNLTGNIGITRFDKGQHGTPTLEDQLIFMKETDYPFGLSDRFNLMGTGVSGEFNKAITNSLQQVGLNPLVSSGKHTEEGLKRWDDLTKKGHATQLHKNFYMLHEKGGLVKARTGLPVIAKSLSSAIKPSSKIITPIVNTLPGFTERRNIIQGLKELGYVGPQTMGADMLKAAKSDESLKKFMQSAIDYDRTGFRQVSGEFHPIGNRLDGYGNHGQYNMYEVSAGNPLSEYENMITRGVDMDNPLSLGAYQATSIPMDQYGYRAGLLDMPRMDGLYLAPTPNTQQYGRYQFKVKQDMDLDSGNWQDLFDQYIIGKNRVYNQDGRVRDNLDPNKVYFADPARKGIEGSGIDTRIWTGGKGKQVGIIDPTFKFTDLKNMSAEDYLDMDAYKKSLINRWNTGFRGDYKKGGMVAKLSKKEIDQYIKDGYIIEDE